MISCLDNNQTSPELPLALIMPKSTNPPNSPLISPNFQDCRKLINDQYDQSFTHIFPAVIIVQSRLKPHYPKVTVCLLYKTELNKV